MNIGPCSTSTSANSSAHACLRGAEGRCHGLPAGPRQGCPQDDRDNPARNQRAHLPPTLNHCQFVQSSPLSSLDLPSFPSAPNNEVSAPAKRYKGSRSKNGPLRNHGLETWPGGLRRVRVSGLAARLSTCNKLRRFPARRSEQHTYTNAYQAMGHGNIKRIWISLTIGKYRCYGRGPYSP